MKSCKHGIAWCENCKTFNKDHDSALGMNDLNGQIQHFPKNCTETFDNYIFNQTIQLIPLMCLYHKDGCQERMLIKDQSEHEKICDYRSVNCFICKKRIVFATLNEHLALHEIPNNKYKFSEDVTIEITPNHPKTGVINFFIEPARKYFLFVYSFYDLALDVQNEPLKCSRFRFGIQYIGQRNDAQFYLYTAKISQGLDFSFTQSARCRPFGDRSKDLLFSMSELFFTDYYLNGFKILIQIKPSLYLKIKN